MKLGFLLVGLILTIIEVHAKDTSSKPAKKSDAAVPVSGVQVDRMHGIMDKIANSDVSSPEELFKIINGQIQTTGRELPVPGAVTEAVENKFRIMCYQEGKEAVVASTDPTLLDKPASDFKTEEGKSIRDLAIEKIGKGDEASFTYKESQSGPMVDGKAISRGRVAFVKGRTAFKRFDSDKKFLCEISAEAHAAG